MRKLFINKDYIKLIFLSILAIIIDTLFLINNKYPPAWDQGYHLSNLFKINKNRR